MISIQFNTIQSVYLCKFSGIGQTSSSLNPFLINSRLIQDLDLAVYRYDDYGKDFIKKCRVSPDVYIQLALQLAYYG